MGNERLNQLLRQKFKIRSEEGKDLRENRTLSRTDRHQKRRDNKRKIIFFSLLAVVFIIILFSLIAFGNNDKTNNKNVAEDEAKNTEEIDLTDDNAEDSQDGNDENENNEENEEEYDLESDVDVQQVESADDNVIVAYTGNWLPIGTSQEGPHTTNYSDGSNDRIEIKRAVSNVTGIAEDDMIEWRVENGGEQKVVSIISNKEKSEYYRSYLTWIDNEGWQVIKVERIKEY